jgi:Holliday junction DNA helicase RuvA
MIYYIKGRIAETGMESVILDNHGIGFEIFTTGRVLQDLVRQGKEEVLLYTHLQIKEDERVLYGFPERSDIRVFRQLISVSGVGPKAALAILNVMTVEELYYAIQSGDSKAIAKAQGVGPKTAQRLVVDLKGSFDIGSATLEADGFGEGAEQNVISETAEALTSLGYSNMDALRAIKKVEGAESMTVEQLLSAALRKL